MLVSRMRYGVSAPHGNYTTNKKPARSEKRVTREHHYPQTDEQLL
jgi:hypothetical protein